MLKSRLYRGLRAAGALAAAIALSGCTVVPDYGPRYGYYHRPHPYYYY